MNKVFANNCRKNQILFNHMCIVFAIIKLYHYRQHYCLIVEANLHVHGWNWSHFLAVTCQEIFNFRTSLTGVRRGNPSVRLGDCITIWHLKRRMSCDFSYLYIELMLHIINQCDMTVGILFLESVYTCFSFNTSIWNILSIHLSVLVICVFTITTNRYLVL